MIINRQTEMNCDQYKIPLDDIPKIGLSDVHIKYEGTDSFFNHWIEITMNQRNTEHLKQSINEVMVDFEETSAPVLFNTGSKITVRIARSPNFQIQEVDADEEDKTVYHRHANPETNWENEKIHVPEAFGSCTGPCDVDLGIGGVFDTLEGRVLSLVCLRVFSQKEHDCPMDAYATFDMEKELPAETKKAEMDV